MAVKRLEYVATFVPRTEGKFQKFRLPEDLTMVEEGERDVLFSSNNVYLHPDVKGTKEIVIRLEGGE